MAAGREAEPARPGRALSSRATERACDGAREPEVRRG